MLFRRKREREKTFADYLEQVRSAGFEVKPRTGGKYLISRRNIAALIEDNSGRARVIERAGLLLGDEIANLVDGGFQKFFQTPHGRRKPALAADLNAVHAFEEDLREALGLVSLYNESLGSVSALYLYDRVKDRDLGKPPRPWEKKVRNY